MFDVTPHDSVAKTFTELERVVPAKVRVFTSN